MKSVVYINTVVAELDLFTIKATDHLSFSKADSVALSCGDISDLITSEEGKKLLFARIEFTSMVCCSLIRIGRGRG